MDAPMEPPMDAPMEAPMVAPMDLSDAAEAQSVPQGSDETVPPCVSGPQYEWAKPNFLAPSETPEEPLLEAASHNLSDTWVDAKRDRGKQDACDFLAMLPDQPLAAGVVKQVQSASDVPQLPGRLPARKGSMSLLPEPSSEASSLVADPSQDGQNSRSQSRRRRRRSNKDRSTGRSRQPKADQAKGEEYEEDFKPPALQETVP
ncbi:unnamed protein product [Cladocopium goreaui]|uniref:Uncharacterized protein n=1 Tax=Cladocopium goreaui TaxID=2562237 RepID=A0A9P1FP57_9DINO|nr:unnamed protein product [Cladocopium goreaui]